MELMQLEMFVAVVEEGSVRRASERVFRTQPAVSIAVRKLEEEFDAPLFDRSKRYNFRLTRAGETFYGYAKRMLSLRGEAKLQLEAIAQLRLDRLAIGANESISQHLIPRIVHAFLKRHPGIHLELKCERSETLVAELASRRLDVALVSFRPNETEFESWFFADDDLVLIANPKSGLARKAAVTFEDLRDTPLFMMEVSERSPWNRRVSDAYLRHRVPFPVQVERAPIEMIKKLVVIGGGVGFVPRLCVEEEVARGELTIAAIEGFRETRSVWLVRRWAMESQAANAFIDCALESRAEGGRGNEEAAERSSESPTPSKVIAVNRRG